MKFQTLKICELSANDSRVSNSPTSCKRGQLAYKIAETSRGFGFLRFSSLEKAKKFMERNYPMIYLYGNGSSDGDEQAAAQVRIAFSRERDDRGRSEKADGEWTCKIVCCLQSIHNGRSTQRNSALSATSPHARNAINVKRHRLVSFAALRQRSFY